ncbi:30S ribosomal protein S16 [Candidatus Uhrbacteria bacterium]|nr:30S ribosomal protein S16 [Candidatus Uhrbacteria bacterium]
MLTIRMSRTGKKKQPYYRVVLQENTRDPWSPAIEVLGNYNPRLEKKDAVLEEERITYWLSKGAQPSATVQNLLIDRGLMKADKVRKVTITAKRAKKLAEEKSKAESAQA